MIGMDSLTIIWSSTSWV